jgi:hypothetical protein
MKKLTVAFLNFVKVSNNTRRGYDAVFSSVVMLRTCFYKSHEKNKLLCLPVLNCASRCEYVGRGGMVTRILALGCTLRSVHGLFDCLQESPRYLWRRMLGGP